MLGVTLATLIGVSPASAQPTVGGGGWKTHRDIEIGMLWDSFTNRNYGGFHRALTWPGGWDNSSADLVERRQYANYKGFVIGARNVYDPQYPNVFWPYMVGQRDGRNPGEQGDGLPTNPPDPLSPNSDTQILFKGRLARQTYRQAQPVVSTDGEINARHHTFIASNMTPAIVGDEADAPYQSDAWDPTIPADVTLETHSWTRMGVSDTRMVYAFVDRRNDDYMFWHWELINDGLWGRLGIDTHECCGGTIDTVQGVMLSHMAQWDRSGAGANRTSSAGEWYNDSVWRYYGADYDGARTEDMRLVYVIDGDQDPINYNPDHGKQNDIGDPDPVNGHLLSAKTGGFQILHYDRSGSDKRDDPAQPRTVGWHQYSSLLQTSVEGHEAKYNQMLYGMQQVDEYYRGPHQETPGRGRHPYADSHGASWIKASNDPATSGNYWPGSVLGVDFEVTDVEQQFGFGPDDIAPFDTVNSLYVYAVKGLDEPYAIQVGRDWLAGTIDDAAKDSLVHSSIDSLFDTMRQAKSVYESVEFNDGFGGQRYAASRSEFETALWQAIDQGKLSLSPPAPASFDVRSGPGRNDLAWTLNTTTGSNIAGWRLYRSLENFKSDSVWVMIADLDPGALTYTDTGIEPGRSYYYYLTTYNAERHESSMHTRTYKAAIPTQGTAIRGGLPLRFELSQNAPNPFNPTTSIPFSIPETGSVSLTIHSVTGQLVRTLVSGVMGTGEHAVVWDGTDDAGRAVASGVLVYRLQSGNKVQVRRLTLLR